VTNIRTENSTFNTKRVVEVETPYGAIKTKHVVNCTGAWANYISDMVIIIFKKYQNLCGWYTFLALSGLSSSLVFPRF
jgi:glycine/D-amino acid oxidase-like deaminating enzyme